MSCRRNGIRIQVTEAKGRPLELMREKGKGNTPREKKRGKERHNFFFKCSRLRVKRRLGL